MSNPSADRCTKNKKTEIKIKISNKIAVCKKIYPISSNIGYVLVFDFDEEWQGEKNKTVRIFFDEKFIDIPLAGNRADILKIPPCSALSVGVYSDNLSSTSAQIGCILSCRDMPCEELFTLTQHQKKRINSCFGSFGVPADDISLVTVSFSNGDTLIFTTSETGKENNNCQQYQI